MLKKITGALAQFSKFMSMATLAAMTSLVLFQIFNRLFFHLTVIWTEEFCRYIFVWMSLFASAYGIHTKGHIAVSILQEMFADKLFVKIFNTLIHVIIIVFCAVVTWQGIKWCGKCSNQYMLSVPSMKVVYVYVALPLNFALMIIFELEHLIEDIKTNWLHKPENKLLEGGGNA